MWQLNWVYFPTPVVTSAIIFPRNSHQRTELKNFEVFTAVCLRILFLLGYAAAIVSNRVRTILSVEALGSVYPWTQQRYVPEERILNCRT